MAICAGLCALGICFPLKAETGEGIKRIISLGPSITEEIYLLGAQDKLVGVTIHCHKPPQAKEKERVGTAVEVNVERITALKPDLVMATSMTSPKSIEKLKSLGVNVVVFRAAESFVQLCDQFLELAKLIGKEKEAQIILKKSQDKVEAVKKSVEKLPRPKVVVQAGAKPLWIATKDSFINDFIELAGGENIGPRGLNGRYSREKVLALNPDVIIITTMGIIGDDEKALWQKYTTISAVQHKRIYIVDSDKFCSPTPVSFVNTLKETAVILHPKNE
ncbi:MAG: ABC transporter substrate-binding protein [Smithellaceae bacterium]